MVYGPLQRGTAITGRLVRRTAPPFASLIGHGPAGMAGTWADSTDPSADKYDALSPSEIGTNRRTRRRVGSTPVEHPPTRSCPKTWGEFTGGDESATGDLSDTGDANFPRKSTPTRGWTRSVNQRVVGSSPTSGASLPVKSRDLAGSFFWHFHAFGRTRPRRSLPLWNDRWLRRMNR